MKVPGAEASPHRVTPVAESVRMAQRRHLALLGERRERHWFGGRLDG